MSGLLDIWKEWRQDSGYASGVTYGSSADLSNKTGLKRGQTERSNLSTAGGVEPTGNTIQRTHRGRGNFPMTNNTSSVPFQNRMTGKGPQVNENISRAERSQNLARKNPNVANVDQSGNVTYKQDASKTTPTWVGDGPWKMRSGSDSKFHTDGNDQQKWWQTFANKIGFDYETAKQTWKDKGGFEGLMANPAFTMGLAFLSAGAEGKNIGQGALDNVMKAGGISQHYKKIIEDRKQAPIEATAADIDEVKTMLDRLKLKEPNIWEKGLGWITGDNVTAKYDRAAEAIAIEYQKEIANMQDNHKGTKPFVIDDAVKERALRKVLKNKRVKQKDGWAIFGPLTSGTIQMDSTLSDYNFRAEGGPVEAGKPYVVGEKGPEIIIPSKDGNVLSNDDSQIYAMLLASNPQLQKVSRARAEKILRARFPEYFE
tara:strand:+ start:1372 stop:2652 length:1281 start_codon:yes stop_codon:yes gene_type:complete